MSLDIFKKTMYNVKEWEKIIIFEKTLFFFIIFMAKSH